MTSDNTVTMLHRAVLEGVAKTNSGYQTVGAIAAMLQQNDSDNKSETVHGTLLRGADGAGNPFYWWIPTSGDVFTANGTKLTLCTGGGPTTTIVTLTDLRSRGVHEYIPGVLQ